MQGWLQPELDRLERLGIPTVLVLDHLWHASTFVAGTTGPTRWSSPMPMVTSWPRTRDSFADIAHGRHVVRLGPTAPEPGR